MKKLSVLLFCLIVIQTSNSQNQIDTFEQSAILTGVKNRKIDDVLILEKGIKLKPGNHKATFLIGDCLNIEEILHFSVESNKKYSFKKIFNSNYYDSVSNSCFFDKELTQIVEEESGSIVSHVVSPIEFSVTDSLGANHYYYNKSKINKNELFHLIINNHGNSFVISGITKDNSQIYVKKDPYFWGSKPINIFLQSGIYLIEYTETEFNKTISNTTYFLAEPNYDGVVDLKKGFSFSPEITSRIRDVGLNNIFFLNSNLGWIVGNDGIWLRTIDGGKTWEPKRLNIIDRESWLPKPRTNTFLDLRDISFTDSISGWIVGDNRLIMHTTDGGESWIGAGKSDLYDPYEKIYFINKQEGFIIKSLGNSRPSLQYTDNGGKSWNLLDDGGVFFVFNKNIWKQTLKGTQLSTDLCKTWKPFLGRAVTSLTFTDSLNGWYIPFGVEHCIINTKDGGKTWVNQEIDGLPYELFFVNENFGWALCYSNYKYSVAYGYSVCDRKIYFTTNGGKNWEKIIKPNGIEVPLSSKIFFLDKDKGFIIDKIYGIVYSTIDGGKNWSSFNVLDLNKKYPNVLDLNEK